MRSLGACHGLVVVIGCQPLLYTLTEIDRPDDMVRTGTNARITLHAYIVSDGTVDELLFG